MYLHSNGKDVYLETLDGNNRKASILEFTEAKRYENKNRIEFKVSKNYDYYFLLLKANYYYFDGNILDQIMKWEFIDTLNVVESRYEH